MLVSVPSRSTMICGCYVEWVDVNLTPFSNAVGASEGIGTTLYIPFEVIFPA
jgi:hypothetical protein